MQQLYGNRTTSTTDTEGCKESSQNPQQTKQEHIFQSLWIDFDMLEDRRRELGHGLRWRIGVYLESPL